MQRVSTNAPLMFILHKNRFLATDLKIGNKKIYFLHDYLGGANAEKLKIPVF
jgi:hypothetical protein